MVYIQSSYQLPQFIVDADVRLSRDGEQWMLTQIVLKLVSQQQTNELIPSVEQFVGDLSLRYQPIQHRGKMQGIRVSPKANKVRILEFSAEKTEQGPQYDYMVVLFMEYSSQIQVLTKSGIAQYMKGVMHELLLAEQLKGWVVFSSDNVLQFNQLPFVSPKGEKGIHRIFHAQNVRHAVFFDGKFLLASPKSLMILQEEDLINVTRQTVNIADICQETIQYTHEIIGLQVLNDKIILLHKQ